jgi:hypothetical protein
MISLAHQLGCTTPVSLLIHKARRLGLYGIDSFIQLASKRGCHHYSNPQHSDITDPGLAQLTNTELTILLISGENSYEPMAIRCAAQLDRSQDVDPIRLATLATRQKADRVLHHIARAGINHDPLGHSFWSTILITLPDHPPRPEPHLPHWSRVVSLSGYLRGGIQKSTWLTPSR